MANSNITKKFMIQTVKEMMTKKNLDQIQVREITQRCGINRNTFYYHFKDKYDILETIFKEELLPQIAPLLTRADWVRSLAVLTDHMKSEQAFYTHAMTGSGGISMADLLADTYRRFLMEESAQMPGAPDRHQRDMIVRFYCHAIMGMLGDWVRLGMKQDVREALEVIRTAVNKNIFKAEDNMTD